MKYVSFPFFILLVSILFSNACSKETLSESSTFESAETDMRLQYPAEKVIPEGSKAYEQVSSGLVTYCKETNCVIVMDEPDEYYRLTIIDEGLSRFELELLKEYIKTIAVR